MRKYSCKKLVAGVLASMCLVATLLPTTLFAAPQDSNVAVTIEVQQNENNGVNWTKGSAADITAMGIGLAPENAGVRGEALARRAAMVDAYRNLAEIIQGVQIDSDTLMEDLIVTSDTVNASVSALVKGATIIAEGPNYDGSYYVMMSVPLYGKKSLASVALAEVSRNLRYEEFEEVGETSLPKKEVRAIRKSTYTGVVVDADNLGLEPTFAPVIYDINGRIVYGLQNLDYDLAVSNGMVGYANELFDATSGNRAGDNPLVVKAVEVKGGKNSVNKVNVVVSVEDADRILLANEKSGMLENLAVVFVK